MKRNEKESALKRKGGLVQVARSDDGTWKVSEATNESASVKFPSQAAALEKAKKMYPSAVIVVKGKEGNIREVRGIRTRIGLTKCTKSKLKSNSINVAIAKSFVE